MNRLHHLAALAATAAPRPLPPHRRPLPRSRSRPSSPIRRCLTSRAPKPTRFVLPNGMVVMVIEDHELPLVNVSARIRTGSLLEPAEKTGLAGLAGTVLRTAARPR